MDLTMMRTDNDQGKFFSWLIFLSLLSSNYKNALLFFVQYTEQWARIHKMARVLPVLASGRPLWVIAGGISPRRATSTYH